MGHYGLGVSSRGFVLVGSDGKVNARAAKAEAALDALFDRVSRFMDVQLVVADDLLHGEPQVGRALAARIPLWIAPANMVEDLRLLAGVRHRDVVRLAAILARLPSSIWLRANLRSATPSNEHQLDLF